MWVDFSTRPRNAIGIQNFKGLAHHNNTKSYRYENCVGVAVLTNHRLDRIIKVKGF